MGMGKVYIPEFKKPKTKKELKSYLGMLGFYRKFIPRFSSIALPLTEATKLKSPHKLMWSQPLEDAFVTLKETLCEHSQLTIPSPEDVFTLSTDASGHSIGAVLSVRPGLARIVLLHILIGSQPDLSSTTQTLS